MKAIIQEIYGGPEMLKLVEVPVPTYNDNQILIKIHSANIASGDMKINTLDVPKALKPIMKLVFGFKGPRRKIRGISASGEIVEVGEKVKKYKIGDSVYFINSMKAGCFAEYVALDEKGVIAKKPDNISYIEAAPVAFGAMSAYHFINGKTIQKGSQVVIYGASGSVGSYALQLAKYYGAIVTAISSGKNHKALFELGADCVIDYHINDFREQNKKYDVIFDAVAKLSKKSCSKVLQSNGKFLTVKMPTKESCQRLDELNQIISEEKLKTLIDQAFPFSEYEKAHKHVYGGHKLGNVVLEIV